MILRCIGRNKRATKTWRLLAGAEQPVKTDFNAGKWFRAERRHLANVAELSNLLILLEQDPFAFVISRRSEPAGRRRKRPDEAGRCWFRDVSGGLHWELLDFDKVSKPTAIDVIADPEAAVLYLVSLLAPCCQDVSFHWQLSGSAGIGDNLGLSAHLWFWFGRPVTNEELLLWAEYHNLPVDTALFRAVQPHYTSVPLFTGMHDPVRRRSGFWRGSDDVVSFPIIGAHTPPESSASSTGFLPALVSKQNSSCSVIGHSTPWEAASTTLF